MIGGDYGEARSVKKKIDAINLGAYKNRFRIVIRDDNPGLVEYIGKIDSISDCFRCLGIRRNERFLGAVHEVKANLQRRTTVRLSGGSRVGFNCNHIR